MHGGRDTYGYLLPRVEEELLKGLDRALGHEPTDLADPERTPNSEKTPIQRSCERESGVY